jgi:multidrug resistance efflux pump
MASVQRSASRGILIQVVVFVVLLGAVALGLTYWYQGQNYVTTDDAQVTAPIAPVGALATGTLATWTAQVGAAVQDGQVLGTIAPAGARPGTAPLDVVAPFAGTVLNVSAVAGQTVTPGTVLAYVGELSQTTVTAYVKETQIRNVAVGQRADVTVDALPGTTFVGQVQQIGEATAATFSLLPSATQDGAFTKVTQVIPVTVSLGAPAGQLLPGESAEVRIHLH